MKLTRGGEGRGEGNNGNEEDKLGGRRFRFTYAEQNRRDYKSIVMVVLMSQY